LSALQVWISYCGWINDPIKPLCWKNTANHSGN